MVAWMPLESHFSRQYAPFCLMDINLLETTIEIYIYIRKIKRQYGMVWVSYVNEYQYAKEIK